MRIGTSEEHDGDFFIGCRDDDKSDRPPYIGPTARVSADDVWLYITTDDDEGDAMLNIEALPVLIQALQTLMARRDAKGKAR